MTDEPSVEAVRCVRSLLIAGAVPTLFNFALLGLGLIPPPSPEPAVAFAHGLPGLHRVASTDLQKNDSVDTDAFVGRHTILAALTPEEVTRVAFHLENGRTLVFSRVKQVPLASETGVGRAE